MSDIYLKAKGEGAYIETPCPLCNVVVGDAWAGAPVVPVAANVGIIDESPLCRACTASEAPLLLSLLNLAYVATVARPDKDDPARVLKAVTTFRAHVFDALQVKKLAFDLEHGIQPRDKDTEA